MRVRGEFKYRAPREMLYDLFTDRAALLAATPGIQTLTQTRADHYETTFRVGIGGLALEYAGYLTVSERRPPESYTISLDARSPAGPARGRVDLRFRPLENESSVVEYDADVELSGQTLIPSLARHLVGFFLHGMERAVSERNRGATGKAPGAGHSLRH